MGTQRGDEQFMSAKDDEVQQAILTGYYNAIMIYLKVANETIAKGGNISDGEAMVRRISNRTFKGTCKNKQASLTHNKIRYFVYSFSL